MGWPLRTIVQRERMGSGLSQVISVSNILVVDLGWGGGGFTVSQGCTLLFSFATHWKRLRSESLPLTSKVFMSLANLDIKKDTTCR